MSQQWYYSRDGGKTAVGPVSSGELRRLAEAGRLSPADLIRKDGTDKTVPAEKVKGLFPGGAVPTAPPVALTGVAESPAPVVPPAPPVVAPRNPPGSMTDTTPLPTPPTAITGTSAGGRAAATDDHPVAATRAAAPPVSTPAPPPTPPSARELLFDRLVASFREVAAGARAAPALAISDLEHVEGRVAGASAAATALRHQIREIDALTRRHDELTRRRADREREAEGVGRAVQAHADEFGAGLLAALRAGRFIGADLGPDTSPLLDACGEADRRLAGMRAKYDELGRATGVVAVMKAKAEQAVLWGKIKLEDRTLAGHARTLAGHVLAAGEEGRFVTPETAGVLAKVAAARAAGAAEVAGLRAAEDDLRHPDLAGAAEFPARRAECERLRDGQEAVVLNGCSYLASRCRAALPPPGVGDGLPAALAALEGGLADLDRADGERQTAGLPDWITYKFDPIERQHVWTGPVADDAPVGFGLRRVKKDGTDRTVLVVRYVNAGMGLKVGSIPGQFGVGSDVLRIAPGESFKLRAGDRLVAFRTVGKPRVRRGRVQMGPVSTDTTTEEQDYAVSPDQLVALAAAPAPVLYRLEGGTEVDGRFEGVAPRVREWVDRMGVWRAVAAHQFVPPKLPPAGGPAAGGPVTPGEPAHGGGGGGGAGTGLVAGLAGAAAGAVVGAVVADALAGSRASGGVVPPSRAGRGVLLDTDGDGRPDAVGLDTDGDGRIDTVGVDTDGDGRVDVVGVDVDGDGAVDVIGVDTDGDGDIDFVDSDPDGGFDDGGGDY